MTRASERYSMILRILTEEEQYKEAINSAVAFETPLDYKAIENGTYEQKIIPPVNGYETSTFGAFDDDDVTLYGSIGAYPYVVRYDGHEVMMRGIGNVATLPSYRRKGAISQCFHQMLQDSYEQGYLFSYLYPFSRAYYRKFGYGCNLANHIWTIYFKGWKPYKTKGRVELLLPEDSHDILNEVYANAMKSYNLSVVRQEHDYAYYKERDTFHHRRYAYVWYNEEGIPKAYLIFRKETNDGKTIMDCTHTFASKNDFVVVDAQGFQGIMDFASTFANDYDGIQFALPSDMHIEGLIHEANYTKCERVLSGMVRVIRVEDVLKYSRYRGSGTISICIEDEYCIENNGTFTITFVNGQCENVEKSQEDYTAKMNIATFSELIVGTYESVASCYNLDLIIGRESDDLGNIFYRKNNRVMDLF